MGKKNSVKDFTGDKNKDRKLIGKIYDIFITEGIDPNVGELLRGKLFDIDMEGYYCFKITTRNSEIDEYQTKRPLEDVR